MLGAYEEFTDRACRVLLEMRECAVLSDHDHTGTEHLLLGLVSADVDLTIPLLAEWGITRDMCLDAVNSIMPPGPGSGSEVHIFAKDAESAPFEVRPRKDSVGNLSPRLLNCLTRRAPLEARALNSNQIGAEHLLIALLKERNGVGVRALMLLGVEPEHVLTKAYHRVLEPVKDTNREEREVDLASDRNAELAIEHASAEASVIFFSSSAVSVFCVLEGLRRFLRGHDFESGAGELTTLIGAEFSKRADSTSVESVDDSALNHILGTIVTDLSRMAKDQLDV